MCEYQKTNQRELLWLSSYYMNIALLEVRTCCSRADFVFWYNLKGWSVAGQSTALWTLSSSFLLCSPTTSTPNQGKFPFHFHPLSIALLSKYIPGQFTFILIISMPSLGQITFTFILIFAVLSAHFNTKPRWISFSLSSLVLPGSLTI